jgi:hypothetical protein
MKIPILAAQNKQRGCMRPAGRHFDIPTLKLYNVNTQERVKVSTDIH